MYFRKCLFYFLIFGFLSACTSLEKNCSSINWHELGRQDSALGLNLNEGSLKRKSSCLKEQSVYAKAYRNGFLLGSREYCTFKTGYAQGFSKLKQPSKACTDESYFLEGYKSGKYFLEIDGIQKKILEKISQVENKISETKEK